MIAALLSAFFVMISSVGGSKSLKGGDPSDQPDLQNGTDPKDGVTSELGDGGHGKKPVQTDGDRSDVVDHVSTPGKPNFPGKGHGVKAPVAENDNPIVVEPPVTAVEPEAPAELPATDPVVVDDTETAPEVVVEDPVVVETPITAEPITSQEPTTPDETVQPDVAILPDDAAFSIAITGATMVAGRVATVALDGADDIAGVRILSGPSHGNVTVNPDQTLAVVLTGDNFTGEIDFSFEVTYGDGAVQRFTSHHDVVAGSQEAGWATGDFYMLETDEHGNIVVETGDDHRPVYVSGSEDALSRADIAALEGISVASITDKWLIAHPEYGGSADMALNVDAGMGVWKGTTIAGDKQTSNWLLLEKGYVYEDMGRFMGRGMSGEDELHPLHITSYGEGDRPVISASDTQLIYQEESANIVFSDVALDLDLTSLSGKNIVFDNVQFMGNLSVQGAQGVTVRNSEQFDVVHENPVNGGEYFQAHADRISGAYFAKSNGVLLEGNFWDQIGWEDGYAADGEAIYGQAPSMYSQNVYINASVTDVTFRDNITMRGASFGAQIRGGGFVEDNIFLDNNAAVNTVGGDYNGAGPVANYTLFADNIVTSGAHKDAAYTGAKTWGIENGGNDTTLLGNIVAHLADPNNPSELDYKITTNPALSGKDQAYYNDTLIYNWQGSRGLDNGAVISSPNDTLDMAVLNQTTIQLFAAEFLGKPGATIDDLGNYLQEHGDAEGVGQAIIDYFQTGFGIPRDVRLEAETLRFIPNDLADGVRWDNRMNWNTDDLPGTIHGDSVDLGGNWVKYGGTTRIVDLDLGSGGKLDITYGKLTVEGDTLAGDQGATVNIDNAGQFWMNGYADESHLTMNLDGGRFVNTGDVTGETELSITDGQVILATSGGRFDVNKDSVINIFGDDAKIGFDGAGDDTAVVRFAEDATLQYKADNTGMSEISEFRSGAMGDESNVVSGANLGGAILRIDATALGTAASSHELIKVDGLIGRFSEIHVDGLAADQDAELVINYQTDQVVLNIMTAGEGSGKLTMTTFETEQHGIDEASDLWNALTKDFGTFNDDEMTRLYHGEDEMDLEAA